jgi:SsrA-binding protein
MAEKLKKPRNPQAKGKSAAAVKLVAQNKKAWHDYFIEETLECGIELFGTEVKSIRQGRVNLKDSYASVNNGEMFIKRMHISPYEQGNIFNKDPLRDRKLLMHKREINRFFGLSMRQGYSIIPLKVYFKGSKAKVEIALAKGKKLYDKREAAAAQDAKRAIDRSLKERNR